MRTHALIFFAIITLSLPAKAYKVEVVQSPSGKSTSNFTFMKSQSGRQQIDLPREGEILYGYDLTPLPQWKKRYSDPQLNGPGSGGESLYTLMVAPTIAPEELKKIGCVRWNDSTDSCEKAVDLHMFETRAAFIVNKPTSAFTAEKLMDESLIEKLASDAENRFCTEKNREISKELSSQWNRLEKMTSRNKAIGCKSRGQRLGLSSDAKALFCKNSLSDLRFYLFDQKQCNSTKSLRIVKTKFGYSWLVRKAMKAMGNPTYLAMESSISHLGRQDSSDPGFNKYFLDHIKIHKSPVHTTMMQGVYKINFLASFGSMVLLFQPLSSQKTLVSVFFHLAIKGPYLRKDLSKYLSLSKAKDSKSGNGSGRSFLLGESIYNGILRGTGGTRLETQGLPGFGKELVESAAQALN